MGVYFPDMKFPQNCGDCDLLYDCCACGVTHKRMDFETMDRERHPDCPAVPVPPHGRLGDLNRLEQMFSDIDHAPYSGFDGEDPLYSAADAAKIIRLAPTIIPAEEGTT